MPMPLIRAAKFAGAIAMALSMAACANTPNQTGLAGAAVPGSQQDFVVNVGDRVFFETDQTDLTPQGPRHPRQAGAVARTI